MKYSSLKGQPSDESHRPSLDVLAQDKAETESRKKSDKPTKLTHGIGIFRQKTVVPYIRCQECNAAGLIYSASARPEIEAAMPALLRLVETHDYICGDALFEADEESPQTGLHALFAIKRHLQAKLGGSTTVAYCNMPTDHT